MPATDIIQAKKIEYFFRVKYERSWNYIMTVLGMIKSLAPTQYATQDQMDTMTFHWQEILQALSTLNYDLVMQRVDMMLDWYYTLPANTFR